MKYTLDGALFTDKESAYKQIKTALELPDWFGNNLDALHDALTTLNGEIEFDNVAAMLNDMGAYAVKILRVFIDSAEENKNIKVTFA